MKLQWEDNLLDVLYKGQKIIAPDQCPPASGGAAISPVRTIILATPLSNTEETTQLEKIMSACQLSIDDYLILAGLPSDSDMIGWPQLKEILIFGLSEPQLRLPFQLPLNCCVALNGKTWIKTHSIGTLIRHPEYKKSLWQDALKPHFAPQ